MQAKTPPSVEAGPVQLLGLLRPCTGPSCTLTGPSGPALAVSGFPFLQHPTWGSSVSRDSWAPRGSWARLVSRVCQASFPLSLYPLCCREAKQVWNVCRDFTSPPGSLSLCTCLQHLRYSPAGTRTNLPGLPTSSGGVWLALISILG